VPCPKDRLSKDRMPVEPLPKLSWVRGERPFPLPMVRLSQDRIPVEPLTQQQSG